MMEFVDGVPVCFGCFTIDKIPICVDCKFAKQCDKETMRLEQMRREFFIKIFTEGK